MTIPTAWRLWLCPQESSGVSRVSDQTIKRGRERGHSHNEGFSTVSIVDIRSVAFFSPEHALDMGEADTKTRSFFEWLQRFEAIRSLAQWVVDHWALMLTLALALHTLWYGFLSWFTTLQLHHRILLVLMPAFFVLAFARLIFEIHRDKRGNLGQALLGHGDPSAIAHPLQMRFSPAFCKDDDEYNATGLFQGHRRTYWIEVRNPPNGTQMENVRVRISRIEAETDTLMASTLSPAPILSAQQLRFKVNAAEEMNLNPGDRQPVNVASYCNALLESQFIRVEGSGLQVSLPHNSFRLKIEVLAKGCPPIPKEFRMGVDPHGIFRMAEI